MGEPHSVELFSTAVQFSVTELVCRAVTFVNYEWIELTDMHLVYGATFTTGRAAQTLYRDR